MDAMAGLFHNLWFQLASLIFLATAHGYIAAWLAVRMLFRPRRPVKLLGLTVWPQGMIPRHRERLAQAIGNAVGNELLAQETVVDALFATDFFQRKVADLVGGYTQDLLGTSYPSVVEALPAGVRAPVLDAVSALQLRLADHIAAALRSAETTAAVNAFVDRRVDELLARRLSDALTDDTFAQVVGFIEQRFHGLVNARGFAQQIRAFVSARVDEVAHSQATLAELFTPDTVALVKQRIDQQLAPIVEHLSQLATNPRTRTQIGALIKREVDDYYTQLSFFKKIFVSRDRIHEEVDELVNKTLPRRVEEFLHGAAFEQEARAFIDTTIDGVLARPINELIGQLEPDKLELIKTQVVTRLLAVVRGPELQHSVAAYATDALARLRPHTVRALLEHASPDSAARLKSFLTQALLGVIGRDETARTINAILSAQIERLLIAPIGRLADQIPPHSVERARTALTERITAAARERLPLAINEFDIGGIVRNKVAAYPVEKLEALVLSVAQQHLRVIELFGLFMGFLIGIGQAVFFYVTRNGG